MTVRLQKSMTGSRTPTDANYRIQTGFVDQLIRGTKCDSNFIDMGHQYEHQYEYHDGYHGGGLSHYQGGHY